MLTDNQPVSREVEDPGPLRPDGFFVDTDATDPWTSDEDAAGRRRRLLEVAGAGAVLVAALMAAVALWSYGTPSGHQPPPSAAASLRAAQGAVDTVAVRNGCPVNPATSLHPGRYDAPAQLVVGTARYTATVRTTAGTFRIALDPALAPKTVNSFVFLAEAGYYNCNPFDRVVSHGLTMTGDPAGIGLGLPGYLVPAERPPLAGNPKRQYPVGSVALANVGSLDAGGSQWFVVTGPMGEALPNTYTRFGRVISGLAVAERIDAQGTATGKPKVIQRVLTITITAGAAPKPAGQG
jgi:cyclophilin family peptidyl-prolyl cis-trans isomerase